MSVDFIIWNLELPKNDRGDIEMVNINYITLDPLLYSDQVIRPEDVSAISTTGSPLSPS